MMAKKIVSLALICALLSGCGSSTKDQQSAPAPKPAWEMFQLGDSITLVIPADNLFEPGTDILIDKGKKVLSEVSNVLKKYPQKNVLITGNTADIGTPAFEKELSLKQARRVANYFEAANVGTYGRKSYYAGLGSTEPIADKYLAKGIATNRRIQITLYEDKPEKIIIVDPIDKI